MDGPKGQVTQTLQFRLSLWLSLVILGVGLVAGLFTFLVAFNEANELQDDALRQTAALFDRDHLPIPQTNDQGRLPGSDAETRLVVRLLSSRTADTGDAAILGPGFPTTLSTGMQTLNLVGEPYRIFVKALGDDQLLAIAQSTAMRNEIALNSAFGALVPLLFLIPILLWVVANLIKKMFSPVTTVSADIEQRSDQDLQPILRHDLPGEIRPFVTSINRLLTRVEESMAMQRRFVADAAHELRTPLTALSLQAERLGNTDMSGVARDRLTSLRRSIERHRVLLNQLLMLARAQAIVQPPTTLISVQQVFRRVLGDLLPLAEEKQIDIGVETDTDVKILASEMDLITMINNLVSNAIHHTPSGGRIDLAISQTADGVMLEVEDDGPGIPIRERECVFQPFYRRQEHDVPGSGLGLSIVRTIMARNGGSVTLTDAIRSSTGLRVVLLFPSNCLSQGKCT
nr:HAMP domain-containing sensor histidine kinase [uncultured Halomonas sp.]